MEEEIGNWERASKVLEMGVWGNMGSEGLVAKMVRVEERMGRGERVREMVRERGEWRVGMEGALWEGRGGRRQEAR